MSAYNHRAIETQIWSVTDLQIHYERHKGNVGRAHWFEKDTMGFFKSKIADSLLYGPKVIYFFSSEKGPNGIRRYSIREYDPETGSINTVGLGFQGYKTLAAAKLAARSLVK